MELTNALQVDVFFTHRWVSTRNVLFRLLCYAICPSVSNA